MMRIVLIGAGNVGFHLGSALVKAGLIIDQVFSRTESSAKALALLCNCSYTSDTNSIIADADVYLVAVRDEVVQDLLKSFTFNPALIAHTSGSLGLDVFPPDMTQTGVFYPLQTFTKNTIVDFSSITICIEGNTSESQTEISLLAKKLSDQIFVTTTDQRKTIHLSAVFANNFTNHLFSISSELLAKENLPYTILHPLILETARKAVEFKPTEIQTGPAKRGDSQIMDAHLQMLGEQSKLAELYRLLSKSILKKHGKSL